MRGVFQLKMHKQVKFLCACPVRKYIAKADVSIENFLYNNDFSAIDDLIKIALRPHQSVASIDFIMVMVEQLVYWISDTEQTSSTWYTGLVFDFAP